MKLLAPAVKLAREGYAVPVNVAKLWKKAAVNFGKEEGEEFKYWFDTFTQDGNVLR